MVLQVLLEDLKVAGHGWTGRSGEFGLRGISRPPSATTMSTSAPAAVRQKYTWGSWPRWLMVLMISDEHRGLKDGPDHGSGGGVLRVLKAGQVAEGAYVQEIDLGSLDQTFAHVGEVRPQDDHLEGGLQDRQPGFGGIEGNAKISGQVGQVEELGASGCQGSEEILEEGKVADLPQRAYVALQIGLQRGITLDINNIIL